MTAVMNAGRVVSVPELQRAWRALQAGQFRHEPRDDTASKAHPATGTRTWAPRDGEHVLPVVGCAGASGASTTALALASAAECLARILERCSGTSSGWQRRVRRSLASIRRVGGGALGERFSSNE